jgi:putative phosphoserine phosphatase/1-acylglycerol-3-phosphate O-acyltransferase
VLNLVDPPLVRIRVGAPVPLKYHDADVDTRKIMKAIMAMLPDESRVKHQPTDEELALTLPPGHHGDDRHEPDRRPGRD